MAASSFCGGCGLYTYRMLLFGIAMIAMMLIRPQGILGERRHQEEFSKNKMELEK